ncbi:uncharacterized protein LOC142329914 [Lycorma delicatula]|uniref:uncharacterized protein LOC142329914 n=1 Tax=Lycorma delicatula TaxID=130591 RepID=UPI003F5189FF
MNDFFEKNNFHEERQEILSRKVRELKTENQTLLTQVNTEKLEKTTTIINKSLDVRTPKPEQVKPSNVTKDKISKITYDKAGNTSAVNSTTTPKPEITTSLSTSNFSSDNVTASISIKPFTSVTDNTPSKKSDSNINGTPDVQNSTGEGKNLTEVTEKNLSVDNLNKTFTDSGKKSANRSVTAINSNDNKKTKVDLDKLSVNSNEKKEKNISGLSGKATVNYNRTSDKDEHDSDKIVTVASGKEVKDRDAQSTEGIKQKKLDKKEKEKESNRIKTNQGSKKEEIKTTEATVKEKIENITFRSGEGIREMKEDKKKMKDDKIKENNSISSVVGLATNSASSSADDEDFYDIISVLVTNSPEEKVKEGDEKKNRNNKKANDEINKDNFKEEPIQERNFEAENKKTGGIKSRTRNEKRKTYNANSKEKQKQKFHLEDNESRSYSEEEAQYEDYQENSEEEEKEGNKRGKHNKETFSKSSKTPKLIEKSLKISETENDEKEKLKSISTINELKHHIKDKNHEKQKFQEEVSGELKASSSNSKERNETEEIEERSFPSGNLRVGVPGSKNDSADHTLSKNNDQNLTIPIIFNLHFYNGCSSPCGCGTACNLTGAGDSAILGSNFNVEITSKGSKTTTSGSPINEISPKNSNATRSVSSVKDALSKPAPHMYIPETYVPQYADDLTSKRFVTPETIDVSDRDRFTASPWKLSPILDPFFNRPIIDETSTPLYTYPYPISSRKNNAVAYDYGYEDRNDPSNPAHIIKLMNDTPSSVFIPNIVAMKEITDNYRFQYNPILNYSTVKESEFINPSMTFGYNNSFFLPVFFPSSTSTTTTTTTTSTTTSRSSVSYKKIEDDYDFMPVNPCENVMLCEKYPYNVQIPYNNSLTLNISESYPKNAPILKIENFIKPMTNGVPDGPNFGNIKNVLNVTQGRKLTDPSLNEDYFFKKNYIKKCLDDRDENCDRGIISGNDTYFWEILINNTTDNSSSIENETSPEAHKTPINVFLYHITLPESDFGDDVSIEKMYGGNMDSDCFLNYLFKVKQLYNVKDNSNIVVKNYKNDFVTDPNNDFSRRRRENFPDYNLRDPLLLLNHSIYCTDNSVPVVKEFVNKMKRSTDRSAVPVSNCNIFYPDDIIGNRYK